MRGVLEGGEDDWHFVECVSIVAVFATTKLLRRSCK